MAGCEFEISITVPQALISRKRLRELAEEYSIDRLLGDVDGKTFTLIFERNDVRDACLAASSAMQALDDAVFDA